MSDIPIDSGEKHGAFLASSRKHVLMITNHGIHQWKIIPGLPDTGGQNVFVNQLTETLAKLGFRITIVNRGGYPHPLTGEQRRGLRYRDDHQRILYLEDGLHAFVRKEDMSERIPLLTASLRRVLDAEETGVDLIISHYWDGARLGVLYKRSLERSVKHIWVPHSLGAIKKRNVLEEQWSDLRIDERIAVERTLIPELDGIASTSSRVEEALQDDYGYAKEPLFLPPCVDTERYHPREVLDDDGIWSFLGKHAGLSPGDVRDRRIVTEISRTDTTKRKDVLIEAFARVHERLADSLLVVSIDEGEEELARDLRHLIRALKLQRHVATVGYVWDHLPTLYAVTDVYCTPSVMEGFGMSVQEAAASGVAVVASDLVPFATEYLLGTKVTDVHIGGSDQPVRLGEGAFVVPADDIDGFAHAMEMLLSDDGLREALGRNAYRITIPSFTWRNRVISFLEAIDVTPEGSSSDSTT